MHESDPVPEQPPVDDRPRCLARPAVARRGFRDDLLCASRTTSSVEFEGAAVPVCGIHLKAYVRWGEQAEQQARLLWAWPLLEPEPGETVAAA